MIKAELQQVLGAGVKLMDSGAAIAKRVVTLLTQQNLIVEEHRVTDEREAVRESVMQAFYTKMGISEGLTTTLIDCGFSTIERITTTNQITK